MKEQPTSALPQNLKAFRERMGLSQAEFASFLSCSREEVSYFETGARSMPTALVTKAAELFGVSEYDLAEGKGAQLKGKLAFAFRAQEMAPEDLQEVASFKKIVMNYLKMETLLSHERGID